MRIEDRCYPRARGRLGLGMYRDLPDAIIPVRAPRMHPNQIQRTWAHIVARQIGFRRQAGRLDYNISAMYIEFENVGDPADPVTIPSYERAEGLEYFNDLMDSATRDFLRVPLRLEPTLSIAPGSEAYFTEGVDGNLLTFFAMTAGTTGVHGKTFSHLVNSKLCGACLVATPVYADRTQDVIFARSYWPLDEQAVKEASQQGGVTWDVELS